ncbi:protein of unknown function [Xenorhabdus bovienii]|uniref:Uncharacterized protein n=1 Tax=Xenorhabdus bovienii TaxID=40576 RepID=A0A0B6X6V0_XENBV|nr:protein of unknown function [Xenorhabdus bovienii]
MTHVKSDSCSAISPTNKSQSSGVDGLNESTIARFAAWDTCKSLTANSMVSPHYD